MPAFTASAPGKVILFGEHAVVYGQPAIAVPVKQVRASATVTPNITGSPGEVRIMAPDIGFDSFWQHLPPDDPIGAAIEGVKSVLEVERLPACTLKVTASIPIASGLGSGAAVSVAIIRALAGFLGNPLPDETVSALTYEVEKLHHGNPSGIDNSVVTHAQPVYFTRGEPIEIFSVTRPFTIVIGDTGIPAPTAESVGDVRTAWQGDPQTYEHLFAAIGSLVKSARQAIEKGHPEWLGPLMDENHELLSEIGVSSPELDRLVWAAKDAGALGAKLSGGGRGGNMIALVENAQSKTVAQALKDAGAVLVITTEVGR
jgi:mevalonate kinase